MYNVVLLSMNGCHYCDDFHNIYNVNKSMKSVNFEEFYIDDNELKNKYPMIDVEKIDGFPTVLLVNKNKMYNINTEFDKNIEVASKKFLDNVKSMICHIKYKSYKRKYKKLKKSIK